MSNADQKLKTKYNNVDKQKQTSLYVVVPALVMVLLKQISDSRVGEKMLWNEMKLDHPIINYARTKTYPTIYSFK